MKLQAYILNGKPLTEYVSWSQGDVNGPPFIITNTIEIKYQDISSVINWDNYGRRLKDFNYVRDRINELTNSIGFNNLTLEEKIISAKYFVVGKVDRDTVLTEEEQYSYWCMLVTESQHSRFNRWEESKKYISYKLTPINSSDLAKSTSELCNDYINYNIITKVKDGISGLFDYLRGQGDYTTNGYPSKSYWTQQDQDSLMDILENGNY
jgi:hypothetical protein